MNSYLYCFYHDVHLVSCSITAAATHKGLYHTGFQNVRHDLGHEEIVRTISNEDYSLFKRIYPLVLLDSDTTEDDKILMIFALYVGIREAEVNPTVYLEDTPDIDAQIRENYYQQYHDTNEFHPLITRYGYQPGDVMSAIKGGLNCTLNIYSVVRCLFLHNYILLVD